ncbi:hypothetical protein [Cohnella silvisoli]|nr:hypothetical protein [Cohnella silvisoli]
MMYLFQLGSTVVFGFAGGAKQDAWLATGLATHCGCGLIWMYTKIY